MVHVNQRQCRWCGALESERYQEIGEEQQPGRILFGEYAGGNWGEANEVRRIA